MKCLLPVLALVCLLSAPAIAGDTTGPGKDTPPTCTSNCTTSITSSVNGVVLQTVITLLTTLLP